MRKSESRSGDHPQQFIDEVKINNKIVKLPNRTCNYCIYDDKVITIVDVENLYPQENSGRNIWCYRDDGTLLWKIEESPHWLEWLAKQSEEERQRVLARGHKDYYSHIGYNKDPKTGEEWLVVGATTGYYDLDPDTGKVSNFEYDGGRG